MEDGMEKIEVLVPVAETKSIEIQMPQRPLDLNGKVIGFLWNNKPNGDLLLGNLKEALEKQFRLAATLTEKKLVAASRTPSEVFEDLSGQCDVVVLAIGD
jgi:hypothetical protein